MNNILLTRDQADKVRGRHGQYSALEPVALDDGRFMLPLDVLDDKEHAEVLNELLECKSAETEEVRVINKAVPEGSLEREQLTYKTISVSPVTLNQQKDALASLPVKDVETI